MKVKPDLIDKKRKKAWGAISRLSPTQVLVLGFSVVILIGAVLLNLPIASMENKSIGFLNALFTSTSAVCVTGLVVVNTLEHWSAFGKVVILLLIQIGGLGFMTLATTLFILLGRKITLRDRLIIQEALNQYSLEGMVRLAKNVVLGTLLIEGIGAFFLSLRFIPRYGFGKGLFMGIFHSISAFCNAGFDIVGGASLSPYVGDILVNVIVMALIILGGLGFTVWMDVLKVSKEQMEGQFKLKRWFQKLTLHSKLVLTVTVVLIVFGFLFFLLSEYANPATLGQLKFKDKLLGALFQSVTTRTAGFNTIPLDQMNYASKFMTIILMLIGGSPAGTAGGIKTVTVSVLLIAVISVVRGKDSTEVFRRRIPFQILQKSLAVFVIAFGVVIGVTMLLSITENVGGMRHEFMDIFFESASAFGTAGLSLGVTSDLTPIGKIIVSITMFIGRVGPVTMVTALSLKQNKSKNAVHYPEERVLVG